MSSTLEGAMTLSIMAFGIATLSITIENRTHRINDTLMIMLSVAMLCVIFFIGMLSVIMLNVSIVGVVMVNFIILCELQLLLW